MKCIVKFNEFYRTYIKILNKIFRKGVSHSLTVTRDLEVIPVTSDSTVLSD
jgi:hypothetical protein